MQGPTASEFSGIGAPGRRRGGPAGATATSFGNYFSVDATEERKRAAESKRAKQAENEAAIDWGAQAWAKIKRADVRQADPRYHGACALAAPTGEVNPTKTAVMRQF
jgi:hypothetical protein